MCIGTCWIVSVLVYHACGGGYEPSFYLHMWPVVPAFLAVNVLFRLYHGRFFYPAAPFSPVEEMRRLVGSTVLVHLGVIAVLALTRQTTAGYSRVVIVLSALSTACLAQPLRDVVRCLLKRLSVGQIPVVLVGAADEDLRQIETVIAGNAYLGFESVGSFDGVSADEAVRAGQRRGVRILLVSEDPRLFRCHLQAFSEWFTHIAYFPKHAVFPVSGSRTVTLDGIGGVEMVNQDQMAVLRLEKWLVDKLLATGAFVLLSPLLLVLAVLVKLSSPGPVFFRHARLGLRGRPIKIWKFRTMYADAEERLSKILAEDPMSAAEWKANFKLRNDPRVTTLGRFLRKTSLDEIPQIFNVLGGSMALVGPRPIVKDEKPYYGASYAIFSSVKPGMTGLWQVSGRSETDYARRVALDVFYALNWSPWLDFWILFRTVIAVVMMRGAR